MDTLKSLLAEIAMMAEQDAMSKLPLRHVSINFFHRLLIVLVRGIEDKQTPDAALAQLAELNAENARHVARLRADHEQNIDEFKRYLEAERAAAKAERALRELLEKKLQVFRGDRDQDVLRQVAKFCEAHAVAKENAFERAEYAERTTVEAKLLRWLASEIPRVKLG